MKLFGRLSGPLLLVIFALISFPSKAEQTSAFVGGNCVDINGMYVALGNGSSGILGNFNKETELLTFARNNGINYLIFYNLEGMSNVQGREDDLANLISRAKNYFGVQQVAAALGAAASADEIVNYNSNRSNEERIDVLNLEYEFWHGSDRAASFQNTLNILSYFSTVATQHNLETEIYIGWITEQEGASLADAVDRVLVHYYRQNDLNIINYGLDRLEYLASGNSSVKIAPIFSNEGPENTGDPTGYFMGPWLETHSIDQPFKTWLSEYQQLGEQWQQNLEVMGSTWFLYNYFADINSTAVNHITSNPAGAEVCNGDSVDLTVTSSAVAKDIGWFKDGVCLTNGGSYQNADSSVLSITSIGTEQYGSYSARVVSYDTGNPTSQISQSASVSKDPTCAASTTNLALGKPVIASSYIAAGYEPGKVVDGVTSNSRWASEYQGDQWVQVDLGGVFSLSQIDIIWDAAYALNYQILVSLDGAGWFEISSVSANQNLYNSFQYQGTNARYIRVLGTQKALPQWGYSMEEIEVYGDAVI